MLADRPLRSEAAQPWRAQAPVRQSPALRVLPPVSSSAEQFADDVKLMLRTLPVVLGRRGS